MIFTKNDKRTNVTQVINNSKIITPINKKVINPIRNHYAPVNTFTPNKDEMSWGRSTWFVFHTVAEKVKDEYFLQIKSELCNQIYRICTALPCLLCQKHAMEYMKNINFKNIKTKDEFKKMLFNFHNVVNAQKNYKQFSYYELEEKYKKGNLSKILENFVVQMKISRNKQAVTHTMYSMNVINGFMLWMKEHYQYFNL
jgi:hypothetical protein